MRILYHPRILRGCIEYGYLYNWYAATDARGIANTGWHVPTGLEWCTLFEYAGATIEYSYWINTPNTVGGKFKETGTDNWESPNTGATNEYGFFGRGGGVISAGGVHNLFLQNAWFWGLKDGSSGMAYFFYHDDSKVDAISYGGESLKQGCSLRLLKDDDTLANYVGNDGKTYKTVKIGNQVWLAENLAETEYADHSKIPIVEEATNWAAQENGAMCAYDNDYTLVGCGETDPVWPDADVVYGLLYNWWAATDARNIAPAGWHVPTHAEADILMAYVGGWEAGGGKLKETGYSNWDSPNTGATNEYNFNGRGSGWRNYNTGLFTNIKTVCGLWGVDEVDSLQGWCVLYMNYDSDDFSRGQTDKNMGMSLRLIKDDSTDPGTMTDNNGFVYPTVKIGDQVWMAANLKTTKYRNGDAITGPTFTNSEWAALTTEAYCMYNDDPGNV